MADALYPKAKEAFLSGLIDMVNNTIKCVLIDTADYTYNAAHDFLDDVPVAARVGTPQTLASKSVTNGVFDAADVAFPSVTGDGTEAVIMYQDTGNEATSRLIAYFDGNVVPNGGNIDVAWGNVAGTMIFAL